jgi:hypothetical protein
LLGFLCFLSPLLLHLLLSLVAFLLIRPAMFLSLFTLLILLVFFIKMY